MRTLFASLSVLAIATGSTVSAAAPPPPPPPGAIDRATAILQMPREGDLTPYVARFAENVTLTERGRIVVKGRTELLQYLQERQRFTITLLDQSYGNPIIAVESISNMPYPFVPGIVHDCCFWARVALYHLDDAGMVDRAEFIENGSYWDRSENPR